MVGIISYVVIQAAVMAGGAQSYEQAYAEHQKTGQPFLILVGADWCPACQEMKRQTLPQMRKRGKLNKVTFAMVDSDGQLALADRLMKGSSIPQLILFTKTGDGWRRAQLNGAHSMSNIESFLARHGAKQSGAAVVVATGD